MKLSVTFDSMEEALEHGFSFNPAGEAVAPAPAKKAAPKKAAKPAKKEAAPVAPAEEEEAESIDLEGLKNAFQGLVKAGKRAEALELLTKYNIKKIHEVAEDDMAAMYADATALLDGDSEEVDPFG